jgi:hypothetical protein
MRRCLPLALVALACAMPAAALDLPARKPGLWEIRMADDDNGPWQVSQFCADAEAHKMMDWMGGRPHVMGLMGPPRDPWCSEPKPQQVGRTIVIESVCKRETVITTERGVITGDPSSDFTVKLTSRTEGRGPIQGALPGLDHRMTIGARWLGACKPDQKPGDVMMDGRKINIYSFPKVWAWANLKYIIAVVITVFVAGAFSAVFFRKRLTA